MDEMHVVPRYGLALLTIADGRTVIARLPTITDSEIRFPVLGWRDTYQEALTAAQFLTEPEENHLPITN